jgi:hypothetical protein
LIGIMERAVLVGKGYEWINCKRYSLAGMMRETWNSGRDNRQSEMSVGCELLNIICAHAIL